MWTISYCISAGSVCRWLFLFRSISTWSKLWSISWYFLLLYNTCKQLCDWPFDPKWHFGNFDLIKSYNWPICNCLWYRKVDWNWLFQSLEDKLGIQLEESVNTITWSYSCQRMHYYKSIASWSIENDFIVWFCDPVRNGWYYSAKFSFYMRQT